VGSPLVTAALWDILMISDRTGVLLPQYVDSRFCPFYAQPVPDPQLYHLLPITWQPTTEGTPTEISNLQSLFCVAGGIKEEGESSDCFAGNVAWS
jgi:hypothetical protein